MKNTIKLRVVESSIVPGALTLRLIEDVNAQSQRSARDVRVALHEAGYRPGDVVILISQEDIAQA